ncbi:MAG: 1-deoxy-D-xylulose-5-phosphate reductoisomerase [Acidobacteriia bacterium]|nr:1-deoxy-D-xylulose-5-phosphate reductoisomerase [Terriglobia bacterium]
MKTPQTLTLLGSTGSIGANTLDVLRRNRDLYQVHALAAGRNVERLAVQICEFRPRVAIVATPQDRERLSNRLAESGFPRSHWPELLCGNAGLVESVTDADIDTVISAIVGVAGLEATFTAAWRGKRVGLATKEVLVAGGKLIMDAVAASGSELLPIDSEHNGAHQCLRAGTREQVSKLILTASGGPFRNTPKEQLASVTAEQALNHPTWRMGDRITIDSATLMNKGFEVIEACWLFGFSPDQVEVVIHPQSTVHALVEYRDGSVLAQIGTADMRMPIQYALTYPDRAETPVPRLNWADARLWEFHPPDLTRFPLLKLAYQSQAAGGSAGCTLNAADEVAVDAFLQGRIGFPAISEIVEETLSRLPSRTPRTIPEVLEIDRESRALAWELVAAHARGNAVTA